MDWVIPVARNELKGVSRNFIRLLVLTQGLILFSLVFLTDAYYVRPPVPSWGLTLAVSTSVASIALVIAIRALPSLRRQAVILRAQTRSLLATRRPAVTMYAVMTGGCGAVGGYLIWNLTPRGVDYFSSPQHYLAVFAFIAIVVLLSFAYLNFLARS